MNKLGTVEDTLFIPLLGRIYASERFPWILNDEKALELKEKLPSDLLERGRQSQYTLLASAVRSANMDRIIRSFLSRRPGGVIAELGCGLETTYSRCDDGKTRWYAVDLPDVIDFRRGLLSEPEREKYIPGDAFSKGWIEAVRADAPHAPLLITAGGLFHYFEKDVIIRLFSMLKRFGEIEIVFDALSGKGLEMMQKKYMGQMGHGDAKMFFHVDSSAEFATETGVDYILSDKPYFINIPRRKMKPSTRLSIAVASRFNMVKMIHLKL